MRASTQRRSAARAGRWQRPWRSAPLAALGLTLVTVAAGCGSAEPQSAARPATGGFAGSAARPAPTPASTPTPAPTPTAEEVLVALVARRTRALAAGSPRRLAALATGAQRTRDRTAARRIRGLGIRGLTAELLQTTLDGRTARLRIRTRYRVFGVQGAFESVRRVTARRTERGWRMAGTRGTRERPPWEVATLERRRTPHFVVFAPPGGAPSLDATLARAYARMRALVPAGRLRRRYLVVVAPTAGDARQLTGGIQGVESLAAITDSRVTEEGPQRAVKDVLSLRMVVVAPVFDGVAPAVQERVVAHELTHAVLASQTSGRAPAWLIEGLAMLASDDDRTEEAATLGTRLLRVASLARPNGIARLSGDRQSAAYATASALAHLIADDFGRRRLFALLNAYADPSIRGATGSARLTDRALRRTLGISGRSLDARLRRRLAAVRDAGVVSR